jgi:hypothetical protein
MVELEQAGFREDSPLDVLVDQLWCNLEALSEELHSAPLIRKADKRELPLTPWYGVAVQVKGLWQ